MPNQTELALLTGQPVATVPQAAAAARTLLAAGLAHVIVTLGGEGALWVTRDDTDLIPPLPVVPVDTTGAGDAFIGSFAHHYVQRGQGEEKGAIAAALAAAARYAAQSITARGTQRSFPSAAAFATFRPHKPS